MSCGTGMGGGAGFSGPKPESSGMKLLDDWAAAMAVTPRSSARTPENLRIAPSLSQNRRRRLGCGTVLPCFIRFMETQPQIHYRISPHDRYLPHSGVDLALPAGRSLRHALCTGSYHSLFTVAARLDGCCAAADLSPAFLTSLRRFSGSV